MVSNVTSLGRSGVYDWMIQRMSALVLAVYTVFLVGFFLANPNLDYATWNALFNATWMRIFSLLALVSIGAHAWIGLWTVVTDYIKPTAIRFTVQVLCGAVMFVYFVWGVQILWGL
ncbi:succinate dehydrogenase, hydrophobic membrane anchor protein [Marinobacteraceae bacterium S3BR75-40.1]